MAKDDKGTSGEVKEIEKLLPDGKTKVTGREIDLPSGGKAFIRKFKGKDVRMAQRMADGDQSKIMFAMIAEVVLLNDKNIQMEDLDDMDGMDVLKLMAEFGNFTSPQSN